MLQTQDKRTTHALARTACFIIFLVFLSTCFTRVVYIYIIIYISNPKVRPYQLIALSPCLPNFLSLSMLHKCRHVLLTSFN